jgi:predicted nucleic acid-binding protein
MTNWIIIDTDILIDISRGVSDAIDCLRQIEKRTSLTISIITQMELIIGCRDKVELHTLERFLSRFHIIRLSEPISDLAVDLLRQYRLSHGLLIADSLIAATATHLDVPLVSKNQRDFQFIDNLRLLPYPKPFP